MTVTIIVSALVAAYAKPAMMRAGGFFASGAGAEMPKALGILADSRIPDFRIRQILEPQQVADLE